MIALYKSRFQEQDESLVKDFIKTFRGESLVIFFNEYYGLNTNVPPMIVTGKRFYKIFN